jgi:hypothetical protein
MAQGTFHQRSNNYKVSPVDDPCQVIGFLPAGTSHGSPVSDAK